MLMYETPFCVFIYGSYKPVIKMFLFFGSPYIYFSVYTFKKTLQKVVIMYRSCSNTALSWSTSQSLTVLSTFMLANIHLFTGSLCVGADNDRSRRLKILPLHISHQQQHLTVSTHGSLMLSTVTSNRTLTGPRLPTIFTSMSHLRTTLTQALSYTPSYNAETAPDNHAMAMTKQLYYHAYSYNGRNA